MLAFQRRRADSLGRDVGPATLACDLPTRFVQRTNISPAVGRTSTPHCDKWLKTRKPDPKPQVLHGGSRRAKRTVLTANRLIPVRSRCVVSIVTRRSARCASCASKRTLFVQTVARIGNGARD